MVVGDKWEYFVDSDLARKWFAKLDPAIEMDCLALKDVFMAGGKVLFATVYGVNARAYGKPVNSYAFLRSDAVAILPVFIEEEAHGTPYIVLARQMRFPAGGMIFECPAGIIDDGDAMPLRTAVREVQEELEEAVRAGELKSLGSTIMSPGGCSESIEFFAFEKIVTMEQIGSFHGKKTGCKSENEDIVLEVVPFYGQYDFFRRLNEKGIVDAKTFIAVSLWDIAREKGK